MCLSGSGVSQQQGEKLIPWIHLLILLGITWDTLTLTTLTGKVQMQGHLLGKPTLQSRREERRRKEARYAGASSLTAFAEVSLNLCANLILCLLYAWEVHRVD